MSNAYSGNIRCFCHIVLITLLLLCKPVHAFAHDSFELHLLDVGQGQSVLIKDSDHCMLIDGGGRNSSSFVVSYLKQEGIASLDYVLLSHYDEDHMAGLIGVLSVFKTETLMVPSYEGEGVLFNSFSDAALSNDCTIIHPAAGTTYQMGDSIIEIVGPINPVYEEENDNSLCVKISYGDSKFLICGDAEQQSEYDMVSSGEDLETDVYVVSHHGSSSSSSEYFLDAINPNYALISCGYENIYGHPTEETLQKLKARNISLFRTDIQGTIIIYSDGTELTFNTEATDDWSPGAEYIDSDFAKDNQEEENLSEASSTEITASYVCNTNTKKFHYPSCPSVMQMSEKNRMYTELGRDELIAQGFQPCGNCKP